MQLGDLSLRFVELMLRAIGDDYPDPAALLDRFDLSLEQMSSPEARLSIRRFMRIGHAIIQETGRDDLGLLMGKALRIGHFGMPGYAIMTAPDLERALRLCIHYERLASENRRGSSRFLIEQGTGVAEFYSISPYNEFNYFVVDCILSGWLTLARWLTATELEPLRIEIEFERPDYAAEWKALTGATVHYASARNALVFDMATLRLLLPHAQAAAHQAALNLCHAHLMAAGRQQPLKEKVRQLLLTQPDLSRERLEPLAAQLGFTPWSLRRALAREGVTVSGLADENRRELALLYLRTTSLTPSQIAWELGYRSQPSFFRAFRRWFDTTPQALRQRELSRESQNEHL